MMDNRTFMQVVCLILTLAITVSMVGCVSSTSNIHTKEVSVATEPQMAATEVTEVTEETTEVTEEVTEPEETEEATEATEEVTEETTEPEEENATVPTSKPEGNGSGGDKDTSSPATKPTEAPTEKPVETQPAATTPLETVPPTTEPTSTNPSDESAETVPEYGEDGHRHDFLKNQVMATCTEKGYMVVQCYDCGYAYISDIEEPTGHDWSDWKTRSDGMKYHTCDACGIQETESGEAMEKETLDCAALIAYGNSYAAGLGFTPASGALPGYYPANTYTFTTMSAAKEKVAGAVYATYANLMALDGSIEGARASVSVWDNGDGTFSIIAYYG